MKVINDYYHKPSALVGYYHIPPVWVNDTPSLEKIKEYQNGHIPEISWRWQTDTGINIYGRNNGFFIFDCSHWEPGAPVTEIIQLGIPAPRIIPREALYSDQNYPRLAMRISAVNIFTLCILNGMLVEMRSTIELGPMISPSSKTSLQNITDDPSAMFTGYNGIPYHALAVNNLKYDRDINGELKRFTISEPALNYAGSLFGEIIKFENGEYIFSALTLRHAMHYYKNHDLENALLNSWLVCERLLYKKFKRYLSKKNRSRNHIKSLLKNNGISASIIIEMLSLADELSDQEATTLHSIRAARNKWVHEMVKIEPILANDAFDIASHLFTELTGIALYLPRNLSWYY